MRILMLTAAVLAVSACNRGAANNSAAQAPAANTATATAPATAPAATASAGAGANGLPDGFLSVDPAEQASGCYGFLTVAIEAGARPNGRDAPIMEQAAGQWLAAVPAHASRSQEELREAFRPMIAAMASVPPAQRDAAADWCVENAPETDPEG
jgi:hypothetical protein